MQVKQLIADSLLQIVQKLSGEPIEIQVLASEKAGQGDYYTNVALRLVYTERSRSAQGKPLDIAYKIKGELEQISELGSDISRIEVVPPGFINFFLSEKYLRENVEYINKRGEEFGLSQTLAGKKVMVEFTDPNPFKQFHIGHLYSNIVGESICRLYESQGAKVMRACYQGDIGLHVAKAVWGMRLKIKNENIKMEDLDKGLIDIRGRFLGAAYALGVKAYEEDKKAKQEIEELNKKIYEGQDHEINNVYEMGKRWSLEYFDEIYKRLGTKFDLFYFESEVGQAGAELVRKFLKKKIFEESEGAIIFPGKKHGLHNRVFINSVGIPMYEAKEMELAPTKYKDFAYEESIIVTGNEVNEYFKVVLKALEKVNPPLAAKTRHISHGMVRLPGGKMSSRTGEVITGEWLLDEVVSRIQREYQGMDDETCEKVGLAAVKYAFLKSALGHDIEFNFEESIAISGASGPYLQYAYVRTKSVINKYKVASIKNKVSDAKKTKIEGSGSDPEAELNAEEMAVFRSLVHFPEVVLEAQNKLAPNLVAQYLFDLAQKFNLFYQKHKIADDSFRLKLTEAVGQTLKNGLALLGIETVDRM